MSARAPVTAPIERADPALIASRALVALGRSCEAVAASLSAAGFTGLVESESACPVAHYLLATDPRLCRVAVGIHIAHLILADEALGVPVPGPVGAFITRFDTGAYPHLIASSLPSHPADPGTPGATEDRP